MIVRQCWHRRFCNGFNHMCLPAPYFDLWFGRLHGMTKIQQ